MTHSLAQRSLVETLATGFLAYSASRAGNADINALDQCLLIGLVLASLIHLCGRASGAHLNPLVSFMLNRQLFDWRSRIFWKETIAYSIAQIIGAVIGFRLDPAGNTTTTFHTISFVPELIFSFALFSLILMWSREGRLCPFSRPLSGVVMGMAIAAMVMAGGRKIVSIAVAGGDGSMLCTPCGACRQRIREFGDQNTPILVAGPDGLKASFTLGDLLPESFGPENLT